MNVTIPESSIPQLTLMSLKKNHSKEVFQAFICKGITQMTKEDQVDILELLMRNLGLRNEFS